MVKREALSLNETQPRATADQSAKSAILRAESLTLVADPEITNAARTIVR